MHDWNVVITVHEDGYNSARNILERHGNVDRTDFFNILLMQTADYWQLLDALHESFRRGRNALSGI